MARYEPSRAACAANATSVLADTTHGSITVAGDEITHMSANKLTQWRARHVGFIFQMYNLIPVLTAYQNVELPLLLTSLSKSERRKHVETALGVVGQTSPRVASARRVRFV